MSVAGEGVSHALLDPLILLVLWFVALSGVQLCLLLQERLVGLGRLISKFVEGELGIVT